MIELVAFDMDGTLVDVTSSWAEVHRHFGENNDEGLQKFMAGEIDDAEFVRRDIRIWWRHSPHIRVDDIEEILRPVPLMPGAAVLFGELKRRGIATAIVSGGVDLLAKRLQNELGVDYVLANGFSVDSDGRLDGEGIIRVPVLRKEEAIERVQQHLGVDPEATAAVGNSEIDVGMFRRAAIGVAFQPADEKVIASATHIIRDKDLTKVLECLDGRRPALGAVHP